MATDVVTVPANEGISIKNEPDDPEINAMAIKMRENFDRVLATARLQPATSTIYINRSGRQVSVNNPNHPNHTAKPIEIPPKKDTQDYPSEIGSFGWEEIGLIQVPYIIRTINGVSVHYVAVRIAEHQLLQKYLHFLHQDIYSCTCVRSHFVSDFEAKLLNEINNKHSDHIYGKDPFTVKDYIVLLEDVKEFYAFLETCYKKLLCNIVPGLREKCGFIRINSESVVPYCIKDNHKYVPLFYFEGETDNLRHRAIKLENWHLAYLKFCCKVQGIRNELFASDACTVTSLDDIKNYFPPDTVFEEYWPAKVVDTQLLTNAKTATLNNTSGSWIRIPHASENPYSAAVATATAAAVVQTPTTLPPPPSMSLWPPTTPNQMINTSSYNTQAQQLPPPSYPTVTRNQSVAAQYYNSNPTLMQSNTPINTGVGHAPPPPLVRAGLQSVPTASGSYSNGSINHTTMYNPVNSTVSHSNQGRQFYGAQRSNSVGQGQQQPQIINQSQQSYGSQSLHGGNTSTRVTNTQQRNAIRNVTLTLPASEIIDLSSPPPSPPPPQQDLSRTNNTPWTLKRIPENSTQWSQTSSAAAYKIQKATLQGKVLYCINSRPFIYSDLMLTLDDLVQSVFPTSTVANIAQYLQKYLKTTLYSGNTEQMAVLRENGRLRSMFPDDTPLAMLQDVTHVFLQLKSLVAKQDEQQVQSYPTNGPSKRQRTS